MHAVLPVHCRYLCVCQLARGWQPRTWRLIKAQLRSLDEPVVSSFMNSLTSNFQSSSFGVYSFGTGNSESARKSGVVRPSSVCTVSDTCQNAAQAAAPQQQEEILNLGRISSQIPADDTIVSNIKITCSAISCRLCDMMMIRQAHFIFQTDHRLDHVLSTVRSEKPNNIIGTGAMHSEGIVREAHAGRSAPGLSHLNSAASAA